jgi:hypothetical protein
MKMSTFNTILTKESNQYQRERDDTSLGHRRRYLHKAHITARDIQVFIYQLLHSHQANNPRSVC